MEILKYKNKIYPTFQEQGFAAQFILPFAKKFCKGFGYDVGCMKKEWGFPGARCIDKSFDDKYDALHLPTEDNIDYIFSSHCLEHVENWVDVLNYWTEVLRIGGILFIYLPHYDQEYWRPWNDRKHIHVLTPQILRDYMVEKKYINIFNSERDLNDSFAIVGEVGDNG